MTCEDFAIVCGDFGFPFLDCEYDPSFQDSPSQKIRSLRKEYFHWVKWMGETPFSVLFVDGNHDNLPFGSMQPVEQWHGGKIHRLPGTQNVIYLMRGEVYYIDGKSIWTFGGAASHDRWLRTAGVDWWPGEVAAPEETASGLANLKRVGNKVDFIITHTPRRPCIPFAA